MTRIEGFFPMPRPPKVTGTNGKRYDRRTGAVYDSPALGEARALIEASVGLRAPQRPMCGALYAEVRWLYPPTKAHASGEPYAAKPDADNAAKLVLDALQRTGWYADDKQVAELRVVQAYGEPSGLYVRIEEIEEEK